ncbi:hypothetical protein U9M48_003166 [Paspalum notatum var. saurae]|uniref:Uncharacterized protein n=1 Tax=Paspalum notatum var. saurae TaxID=547442 RepID=A0AAQ3SDV5_PASNO
MLKRKERLEQCLGAGIDTPNRLRLISDPSSTPNPRPAERNTASHVRRRLTLTLAPAPLSLPNIASPQSSSPHMAAVPLPPSLAHAVPSAAVARAAVPLPLRLPRPRHRRRWGPAPRRIAAAVHKGARWPGARWRRRRGGPVTPDLRHHSPYAHGAPRPSPTIAHAPFPSGRRGPARLQPRRRQALLPPCVGHRSRRRDAPCGRRRLRRRTWRTCCGAARLLGSETTVPSPRRPPAPRNSPSTMRRGTAARPLYSVLLAALPYSAGAGKVSTPICRLQPRKEVGHPALPWLDVGQGKDHLPQYLRTLLRKQCIRYLGPKHRGEFQHSSFFPGATTIAVGRFSAENGVIKVRSSTKENCSSTKENYYEDPVPDDLLNPASAIMGPNLPQVVLPQNTTEGSKGENAPAQQAKPTYQRTLSGGLQSEDEIQERVQFLSAWPQVVFEMEHWGWSKNWVLQGLPSRGDGSITKGVFEMEHWGWSKNWVLQGLPSRDGGSITKGIHSICLKETSCLSPTNKTTTPTSPLAPMHA